MTEEEKSIWFLRKNKQNIGPLSKMELLNLLFSGEIDNNDYVWKKGLGNWMQIKELYELKATKEILKEIEADEKKKLSQLPKLIEDTDPAILNPTNITIEPEPETEVQATKQDQPTRSLEPIKNEAPKEELMQVQPDNSTKAPRTPKKLMPEFIFGIILSLIGGYQMNNNIVLGGVVAGAGIIMILAYIIVNRKKGVKDATSK